MKKTLPMSICALVVVLVGADPASAQRGAGLTEEQRAHRWALENRLQSIAFVERQVMIPMRDRIRVQADIYRPRDTSKRYPTI